MPPLGRGGGLPNPQRSEAPEAEDILKRVRFQNHELGLEEEIRGLRWANKRLRADKIQLQVIVGLLGVSLVLALGALFDKRLHLS